MRQIRIIQLKQEGKSKKPCNHVVRQHDCLDMEEIWTNFAIQLEKFEEYCIDALEKMESKKIQKSSVNGLFKSVLAIDVKCLNPKLPKDKIL